jgi:hypothetical protein
VSVEKAPARIRVAGGFFVLVGVITIIGATGAPGDLTHTEVVWNIAIASAVTVLGAALCFDARWAWPPALLGAASAIGLGLYTFVQPGDITSPGANIVAVVVLILPGALLCAALLSPVSVRWFRRRPLSPTSGTPSPHAEQP